MKNRHILCVSEDKADLAWFKHQFQDFYTIHTTDSVDEACRLVRQHDVHVVLADLRQPGTVGAQILARIGNNFPDAIRYIVIDYSDMDAIAAAADKGLVYDYFQRPWDARKMKLVIDNALEIVLAESDRSARLKDVQNVEAPLNERDTLFHALLEAAPDAIIVVDEDGKIVLCNAQSERLFGYPRDEILGNPIEKLIPERFRNHEAHRRGFIADPGPREMGSGSDLYLRGKDGIEIPVEIALSPLNANGDLLVIAAIRDVTERKQAVQALVTSEETLRAILEAMPLAVFIADSGGKIYYTNHLATELAGRSFDESAQGKTATQLFEMFMAGTDTPYPKNDLPIYKALSGKKSRIDDVEVALSDGRRRSLEVWGSPVYDAEGAIKYAIATADDITERKVLEAKLRQAQKMEAIGQLTGGISHDFNNLLSIIMMSVDLLSRVPADSEDSDGLMTQIKQAVRRGESLTRRLLAFSRRQTLQPQIINVNELVTGNLDALRRMLTEAIEIQTELDDELWMTKVDPGQLEDALLNLVINARDAMPSGGTLIIRTTNSTHLEDTHPGVAATWTGDFAVLSVTDTGIGMSTEVLEHVFEPFFTTKEVGEGSGLGLSMVYGFAKQTEGHLTIESVEGEGTTVSICLPRETGLAISAASEDTSEAWGGGGETILIVEDNEELQDLVAVMLRSLGYHVLLANNGHAALVALEDAARVDLLLSDVVLPGGMNGIDLLPKAQDLRPNLRCLFMSGYTALPQDSLPENINLLHKPFRMNDLALMVRKALGRKVL